MARARYRFKLYSFLVDNQSSNQVGIQIELRQCNCTSYSDPRSYPCLLESPLLPRSGISICLRPQVLSIL